MPKTNKSILLGTGYLYGSRPKKHPIYWDLAKLPHKITVGGSGSGKSCFLHASFRQFIAHPNWNIWLFDPHSDLFSQVLSLLAYEAFGKGRSSEETQKFLERVVIIDPTDLRRGSPGINILEHQEGQLDYEVVSELISAFASIWKKDGMWGPRLEDYLRQSCLLLNQLNLTLAELPRLISDTNLRTWAASQSSNEDVRLFFFKHLGGFSEAEYRYVVESTRNKVSAFLSSPFLHPILAQANSTVRFAEILNQPGKIVLINLSRAHLKTEARSLFGALLFTKFHLAMLLREHIPESQRLVTIAFVDEFAEIFCESFLDILVGGRKYKTFLALYLQSLAGQLEPEDVNIILGNTGVRCAFRVGRVDAERLCKEFFNFSGTRIKHQEGDIFGPKGKPTYFSVQDELEHTISELTTQQVRELYISMKGLYNEPFIATTLPVEYPSVRPEWEEALRDFSASKYNRSQTEIEAELQKRKEKIEAAMREANAEPSHNVSAKPIRPRRNKR